MKQEILNFIKSQRICVLAVQMLDGSPHAATVHFANSESPLEFFFLTDKKYRKCEALLNKGKISASVVIGFDENNMKTLQLDGEVILLEKSEIEDSFNKIYFGKFPEKLKWLNEPDNAFLRFIPTWWRFTDYTKPEGKLILLSDKVDFKL
jgi:uncharacterized protein YhbP (UPF0306 family)